MLRRAPSGNRRAGSHGRTGSEARRRETPDVLRLLHDTYLKSSFSMVAFIVAAAIVTEHISKGPTRSGARRTAASSSSVTVEVGADATTTTMMTTTKRRGGPRRRSLIFLVFLKKKPRRTRRREPARIDIGKIEALCYAHDAYRASPDSLICANNHSLQILGRAQQLVECNTAV